MKTIVLPEKSRGTNNHFLIILLDRLLINNICFYFPLSLYIQNNNLSQFGELMNVSHYSYSNDFEASTEDVDLITKRSVESGAAGSRLTGGGFGGFTVSLIEKTNYDLWYKNMRKYYSKDKFFTV